MRASSAVKVLPAAASTPRLAKKLSETNCPTREDDDESADDAPLMATRDDALAATNWSNTPAESRR
jgi:hypothetical protein